MDGMIKRLMLAALAAGSMANAQVGGLLSGTQALPDLKGFVKSGDVFRSVDGVQLRLEPRGPYLGRASVTLPSFDAQRAGVLFGALSGYGDELVTPFANFLTQNKDKLAAGVQVKAQEFVVDVKLDGAKLLFALQLAEVPANKFAPARHSFGDPNASVVIREYSDFQCPYCQKFTNEVMPKLRAALPEGVRFEFHQFPLESIHPNARAAAEASECAGRQGQFWAFHDDLFANRGWVNQPNPNPAFLAVAGKLKLDAPKFSACLAARDGKAAVDAGLAEGEDVGVNGTPSVFVNGFQVSNPYDLKAILDLIGYVRAK